MSLRRITQLYNVVYNQLFTINRTLAYDRTVDALERMVQEVKAYDNEEEDLQTVGEYTECGVYELIIGAYNFFIHHHSGMHSREYAMQCLLGSYWDPGMGTFDPGETRAEYSALCEARREAGKSQDEDDATIWAYWWLEQLWRARPRSVRLAYLRVAVGAERITEDELTELQDLAKVMDRYDIEQIEALGLPKGVLKTAKELREEELDAT